MMKQVAKTLDLMKKALKRFFLGSEKEGSWAKKQISEMARLGGRLVL